MMSQTIDEIKREVLSKLNLQSEFESWGCFTFAGKQSAKGFIPCFSPFKSEKNPSCGLNVDSSSSYAGMLKIFNGSGPRQVIQFFDLARELSPRHSGKEFIDILKSYSEIAGVEFDYEIKKKKLPTKPKGKIIAIFDYKDESGTLIYQVCRLQPKSFRQRRPDPGNPDSFIWNMEGVIPLPYHINNVIDNKTIYITEGEGKCDDLINNFNLPATTFHGGAGKFWPEVLPYFKGKHIILLPDNDDPGKKHMARLAGEFVKTAASVKILELPDLKPKGDVSDWIASGGTRDQLLDLCKKTLNFEASECPIDELNKTHAVIMIGGKVRVLFETKNFSGRPDIQFLTEYDFKVLYANRKIPNPLAGTKGQPKHLQLATAWLGSAKRREYRGIIFEPQIKNDKFYNLFSGLAYHPSPGDWSLFKKHIFENICAGNLSDFDWLISWLARTVQHPGGEKPGTAVVMRGERGTGKGIFAEIFGKIFGHHFLQITNSKQATGRFNAHLKDCLLLYLDEAWFAGDKGSESVLKGLITSDRHMIELKGKDAFMVSNHVNCIVASNASWVVPVGNKERRFFLLDVSNAHIQDHQYFKAIYDQMYKNGGISAMLHDLLAVDISRHNLREVPKTTGLFDQLIQNFSSFEQFWFEKLLSSSDIGYIDGFKTSILTTQLYDQYADFSKKINAKYILTPAVFGKNLSKYCDVEVKQRLNIDQKPARFYFLPDKTTSRQQFSKQIGMKIKWNISQAENIDDEVDGI
ncbi:MAG: hypothetical protein H8E17_12610 [Deltaproteobacteria bacterium]|nr:hypothetical protein [Deltaproteobacteria bacterium]